MIAVARAFLRAFPSILIDDQLTTIAVFSALGLLASVLFTLLSARI
jgi:uncharacterized MnhB-related membrane protein